MHIAFDLSNTLDTRRRSGLQRLAVRTAAEVAATPGVDLTILDGRSRVLRPLTARGRTRLFDHFDRAEPTPAASLGQKALRRVIGRDPRPTSFELAAGSWLIDIDPAWHAPVPRNQLLPRLNDIGVRTAAVVPDLLPITNPAWFPTQSVTRFSDWIEAHRDAASRWFAISSATAAAMQTWGLDDVAVLRLGADPVPPVMANGPLVLMIGTVEPRKGHDLILDALDELGAAAPIVDIVGSPGWASAPVLERLAEHPSIRWHQGLSDAELNELWTRAGMVIQPSRAEGFGLPVAEALGRRIPTAVGDIAVLREAAQGTAEPVALDAGAWAEVLRRFANGDALRSSPAAFVPHSWADTSADLIAGLR